MQKSRLYKPTDKDKYYVNMKEKILLANWESEIGNPEHGISSLFLI